MPTTINGIGTNYLGKTNCTSRTAACQSCGRVGDLQSYDTRLWFVFVFIPVIPLGRKRILDQCPACRRHHVADQAAFVRARHETLADAMQAFQAEPSAEGAIDVHAQMLSFSAQDDARSFRETVLSMYPDHALLHAALAQQLDETNQQGAATPLFERAFELDPTLPEARVGLAWRRLTPDKLDEARELLKPLEQTGAGESYPLHALYALAKAYQEAGRHEDALLLCQQLRREVPELEESTDFRKLVRLSEKASPHVERVFPEKTSPLAIFNPGSPEYSSGQRWAAYLAVLFVIAVVGLLILNEYSRQHRTVVVRNEFGPAAQVVIDGDLTVPPGRQEKLVLAEGTHHVSISGALEEDFDVNMQTGYWGRWTNKPAWIINVGGVTQLMHYTIYYAKNPRPTESEFFAGENVFFVPHVDYLFVPSPDSLDVDNDRQEVTKHELSVINEAPNDVFHYLLANESPQTALHFAESALTLNPEDNDLLEAYYEVVAGSDQESRAKELLEKQLEQRPVLVNWHRYYHELHRTEADRTRLLDYYDAQLEEEPNHAALLYLRGRLTRSSREAERFYARSMAADRQFSWPWAATGYLAYTTGDWQRSKECFQEALKRGHEDSLQFPLLAVRLGLGENVSLERELRRKMAESPSEESLSTLLMLTTVLTANGDGAGAKRAVDQWEEQLPADERPAEFLEEYRGSLEYNSGDMAAVERRIQAGKASKDLRLYWLLVKGKPQQAAADPELETLLTGPWKALALSLAFTLAGEADEAEAWRQKAADALPQQGWDEAQAAELLRSAQPPTQEQIDDVSISPAEKSLLVAALATRFPQEYQRYAAIADHLCVQPSGFAPIVKQVVARGQQ